MKIIIAIILFAVALGLIITWFNFVEWCGSKFTNFNVSFGVEMFVLLSPIIIIASVLIN